MWTCEKCGTMRQRSIAVCSHCGFIRRVGDTSGIRRWRASRASSKPTDTLTCPLCQSTRIMNDIRVHTYRETQPYVRIPRRPTAMVFTNAEQQYLYARICGKCGYTAFFTEDPEQLWAAYREGRRNQKGRDLDVEL